MKYPQPTIKELEQAREAFERNEPRDLFYRVATELVDSAIKGSSTLSLSEALSVLLQTWNAMFYRYNKFDEWHFSKIEQILNQHKSDLLNIRKRKIDSFREEVQLIKKIFRDF